MAEKKPKFLIQYERPKSSDSGLTRFLLSKSNWVTVGSENDRQVAIEKAQSMPGRVRVLESRR